MVNTLRGAVDHLAATVEAVGKVHLCGTEGGGKSCTRSGRGQRGGQLSESEEDSENGQNGTKLEQQGVDENH